MRIAAISIPSTNTAFAVSTRPKPGSPGSFEAMVSLNSSLLKSIIPTNRQIITGLNVWFQLLSNDFIWLEILTDNAGNIISANIASYGLASNPTWTPSANPGASDGPFLYNISFDGQGNSLFTQTNARVPIAQAIANSLGEPQITQLLTSNLLMEISLYQGPTDNGLSVISIAYPKLWVGPYL